MSQIEQDFRLFLSRNPEVEKCYSDGLINRRSLARHLIQKGVAKKNQLEAVIAMLRRFEFKKIRTEFITDYRISIKDGILILDFEKDKEIFHRLEKIIQKTDYDKGDTLKIVMGSTNIKLFIDKKNESKLKELISDVKKRHVNLSELSIQFPNKSADTKGILSTITRELAVNGVTISEFLTATPELLIYLDEKQIIKAYEVLKRLQEK